MEVDFGRWVRSSPFQEASVQTPESPQHATSVGILHLYKIYNPTSLTLILETKAGDLKWLEDASEVCVRVSLVT